MERVNSTRVYESRRGPFFLTEEISIEVIPDIFKISEKRLNDVKEEIEYAKKGKLKDHKYWDNEPLEFILEYQGLYQRLFNIDSWIYYKDARHNVVVNPATCVTLVQYFDGQLIVYSRSTDMKNGYFGDKVVIHLLRQAIRAAGFVVNEALWIKAIPHEYVNKGIARLLEGVNL